MSGLFGIGGALITTPAIRLLLGVPALIAVGTPLVAIIPGAVTGAVTLVRAKVADVRTGLVAGVAGALFSAVGAVMSEWIGGRVALVLTGALLLYFAVTAFAHARTLPQSGSSEQESAPGHGGSPGHDSPSATQQAEQTGMKHQAAESTLQPPVPGGSRAARPPGTVRPIALGIVAGFAGGLLGLGGGFVLVPMFSRLFGFSQRKAVATSLISVSFMAIPGMLSHARLGHVDWRVGLTLAAGAVLGAWVGARLVLKSSERVLRYGFAVLLALVGIWLVLNEVLGLMA